MGWTLLEERKGLGFLLLDEINPIIEGGPNKGVWVELLLLDFPCTKGMGSKQACDKLL